ncbi:unnamed protein product [Echinostoma caproni]|uniref:Uncharacterized protein n=1 Tax=Echinostoma caproni TaxID=27848 RepID=A0A183ATY8_9TREM|nr:unnamed protein product [Echinostoma caproni]
MESLARTPRSKDMSALSRACAKGSVDSDLLTARKHCCLEGRSRRRSSATAGRGTGLGLGAPRDAGWVKGRSATLVTALLEARVAAATRAYDLVLVLDNEAGGSGGV